MFGNMQGWIVSAVMLGLTVGLIVWKGQPEGRSKPTGQLKTAMVSADIKVPDNILAILPKGTRDADAGDVYRRLAASVAGKSRMYDLQQGDFMRAKKKRTMLKQVEPEMDLLIEAAECNRMTLFKDKPEEVVNYKNRKPILDELNDIAKVAVTVAGIYATADPDKANSKPDNPEKARKLFGAVFHLGRFLAEERVIFAQYRIGVDLMDNGAGMMGKFGGVDKTSKDELDIFSQSIRLGAKYETVVRVLTGIPEEGKLMALPGDIFDLALNSKEPMWQTEAILKLGRMRYMSGVKYGDQRDAAVVLAELAARNDLPPGVKRAAIAARDLTIEQFRMIGGSA